MKPKKAIEIMKSRLTKYASKGGNSDYIRQSEEIINSLIALYNDYESVKNELEYRTKHEAAIIEACLQPYDDIALGLYDPLYIMDAPLSLIRWHQHYIWFDQCTYDLSIDKDKFFNDVHNKATINNIMIHHKHILDSYYYLKDNLDQYNHLKSLNKIPDVVLESMKPGTPDYVIRDIDIYTEYFINKVKR